MNANETRDIIRMWLAVNEPRMVARFDNFVDGDGYSDIDRMLRLAFKAGVDYGTAKASALSGMLHKGEQPKENT